MHKNLDHDLHGNIFVRESDHFHTGQRIIYEGEEAEVIKVTPFLVIKTKNRVVCGAIHHPFKFIK